MRVQPTNTTTTRTPAALKRLESTERFRVEDMSAMDMNHDGTVTRSEAQLARHRTAPKRRAAPHTTHQITSKQQKVEQQESFVTAESTTIALVSAAEDQVQTAIVYWGSLRDTDTYT